MAGVEIRELIKQAFPYLFTEYGFTLASETYFEDFGNWVIVLTSRQCRLRLLMERGDLSLAAGPLWSPPSWQAGPWFELPTLTAYLDDGRYTWDYERRPTKEQLDRLSGILRQYLDKICDVLGEKSFPMIREKLERMSKKYNDL